MTQVTTNSPPGLSRWAIFWHGMLTLVVPEWRTITGLLLPLFLILKVLFELIALLLSDPVLSAYLLGTSQTSSKWQRLEAALSLKVELNSWIYLGVIIWTGVMTWLVIKPRVFKAWFKVGRYRKERLILIKRISLGTAAWDNLYFSCGIGHLRVRMHFLTLIEEGFAEQYTDEVEPQEGAKIILTAKGMRLADKMALL